ncbi:MAG: S9 family peptidase, partial [Gammaproteobacteria bacterium]|nr:S9 family peptidase [Gammaproteobacteria bacterium]
MLRRLGFAYMPVILLLLVPLAAWAGGPIQLQDFRALVRIESPQFSPDGQHIAFLTVRSDMLHDRYDATLRVMDTAGGHQHALVRGMRDLKSPRWSPDGHAIAFIARLDKQKPQIFSVPAAGGTPQELSDADNGVQQFSWSPDGGSIAYVTPDDSPISKQQRRFHHDLFTIHDDDYLIDKPPVPSHIWLLTPAGGKARQLTFGSASVLENAPPFPPFGGITAPTWSADGHWIAYTQQANAHDSDSDRTRIMVVNVATGAEHPLTGKHHFEYVPRFAPKGEALAWLYPHGPGPVSVMDLYVGSPAGGTARDLNAGFDRDLDADFAWLPDAKGFVVSADDHVGITLYLQPLHGKQRALNLNGMEALHLAVSSRGALAVVADGTARAPELYLLRSVDSRPVRLTDFNRAFNAYAYPRSVELEWRAPDGQADDGILTYPNGYVAGKKYPLVVWDHGGPEASSSEGFDTNEIGPLRDLFAADGYLVFEPNYRGSDNLGNAHEHAIFRDPGAGPDSDVISGIQMLEKQGLVDESRIAAAGHSYGGYMTAWL